jgi:hypothetical protein
MYDEIRATILKNYEKRGKIISEKSVDKYLLDIKKIQTLLGDKGDVDDLSFLYNFNDVRSVIENMRGRKVDTETGEKVPASDNTKRNYFQSIVSVLEYMKDDTGAIAYYQKVVNDYNKKYKQKVQEGGSVLTPENEEKLIPYDDLIEVLSDLQLKARAIHDKYKKGKEITEEDMNNYQMYLLLTLYTRHPARNEFATLMWATPTSKKENDKNYLVYTQLNKDTKMIINEYKTKGLYETRELDTEGTASLFRFWKLLLKKRMNTNESVKWIDFPIFYSRFFDIEGDKKWYESPMTSNMLSKYFARFFQKAIGKSLSTTAIAKIVISHRNKKDSDNMKKTSKDRGTSVGTLSEVYSQVLPEN